MAAFLSSQGQYPTLSCLPTVPPESSCPFSPKPSGQPRPAFITPSRHDLARRISILQTKYFYQKAPYIFFGNLGSTKVATCIDASDGTLAVVEYGREILISLVGFACLEDLVFGKGDRIDFTEWTITIRHAIWPVLEVTFGIVEIVI